MEKITLKHKLDLIRFFLLCSEFAKHGHLDSLGVSLASLLQLRYSSSLVRFKDRVPLN